MTGLNVVFNVALGNFGSVLLTWTLVDIKVVILGLMIFAVTRIEAESLLVGVIVFLGTTDLIIYVVPWGTMLVVAVVV